MNLVAIAKSTMDITAEGKYSIIGKQYYLPQLDFEKVIVCSPEEGEALLNMDDAPFRRTNPCNIIIENCDSFQSAKNLTNPLVMNFANAHVAGGGFLLGAVAQEEALCRCSTLSPIIPSDICRLRATSMC